MVGAEGAERGVETACGDVEGDELREEDRVAEAAGDEEAGVELRWVRGAGWPARLAASARRVVSVWTLVTAM
jgi:hypothetical protein